LVRIGEGTRVAISDDGGDFVEDTLRQQLNFNRPGVVEDDVVVFNKGGRRYLVARSDVTMTPQRPSPHAADWCTYSEPKRMRPMTPEEIEALDRSAREFVEIALRPLLVALLFTVMCFNQPLLAQQSFDAAFRLVDDAVKHDDIPGAIALVAHRGRILREEAFGVSDVENMIPMTPRTLCWIASITKPVTVAAAMKLVEQGQISLDDPVEKFLPEFAAQEDRAGQHRAVTIRQLMNHTSGIQPNPPSRPSLFFEEHWMARKISDIAPLIAQTTLEFEPGSQVKYSNAAPYVLGRIIELKSGKPFHEFVQQSIFSPAGMNDSHFIVPTAESSRVAVVYRDARGERTPFCRYDPGWKVTMTMPDGGLFSYPREIMKFLQLFLDDDGSVFSQDTVRAMRSSQAAGWGLGWSLEDDGLFHHFGSSGTSAWADPRTGLIGILFFQVQNPQKTDALQSRFRSTIREASVDPGHP
jgi:CubicO group peptidase (beta-lactamase class C family)